MSLAAAPASPPAVDSTVRWLKKLVGVTRSRLRLSWVGAGFGLLVGLSVAVLLVAAGLDLLLILPTAARWIAFGLTIATAAALLLGRVFRPLLVRLPLHGVAMRIERHLPGIHNRLVTVLDLSRRPIEPDTAPFYRVVVQQAADRVEGFRPNTIVDRESIRRASLWAAAPTLVLLLGLFGWPQFVGTALARILQPWADIPPASLLTIQVEPGDGVVLLGEPATIAVHIGGAAVKEIRLQLTDGVGLVRTVPVPENRETTNEFLFTIDKFQETLKYRVFAGRTWTRAYTLELVQRPILEKVRTFIHPPAYLEGAPVREVKASDRTIAALAGSSVEVRASAVGEVAEAFLPLRAEKYESVWTSDLRSVRWWLEDEAPQGSGLSGRWMWDWSQKFHRTHFEPADQGEARHSISFNPPIPVRTDDMLFTHVFIDPAHVPNQILLEFRDVNSWDHRIYWGENKLKKPGAEGTAANLLMGPLPPSGQWVRLEIPARLLGLDGKTVYEMAFSAHGGAVRWDWFGACTGRDTPRRILSTPRNTPLLVADGGWKGSFTVDRPEVYTVELRDAYGHANQAPEEYRVAPLVDQPPSVRIDQPGKDIVLSSPAAVPMTAILSDDYGLAKAEIIVIRQRETKTLSRPLVECKGIVVQEVVRSLIPVQELDAKPGDVFTYRVRVFDRKGQSADSSEFRVTIQNNDNNAFDKQQQNFTQKKDKIAEKLRKLAAMQQEVAEKTKEIAVAHQEPEAPPTADPQPETPEPMNSEKDAAKAAEEKKDPAKAAKADAAKAKAEQAKRKQEQPKSPPLTQEERKELGAVAQKEQFLQQQAEDASRQLSELVNGKEAETASSREQIALADVERELNKSVDPDLKAAVKEIQEAVQKPDQPKEAAQAAEAAEKAKNDLDRVVAKLDRMDRLDQLSKPDADAAQAAEAAALQAKQDADAAAAAAADKLEDLKNVVEQLRQEVGQEQTQQEKLMAAAENAKETPRLQEVGQQQKALEQKAGETLQQVQEALGDAPPRDLGAERMQKEGGEGMAEKPPEGGNAEKPTEAQPADGKPDMNEKGEAGGDPPPAKPEGGGAEVPEKGGTEKGGQPQPEQGAGEHANQEAGGKHEAPQFEILSKQAPQKPGKRGKEKVSDEQRRAELGDQQAMLARDLDKAGEALEQRAQELTGMAAGLKEAAGDPGKLGAMMKSDAMQQQLALAEKAGRTPHNGEHKPGKERRVAGGRGMTSPIDMSAAVQALLGLGKDGQSADSAVLRLQPRDREELIQGVKAPAPESYKPYVRDYYNRLTEVKSK